MNKFFKNILTESNGDFSSTRIILLAWFMSLTLLWVINCIAIKEIVEIPNGVYMLSGVIAGLKAVQKFGEQKS